MMRKAGGSSDAVGGTSRCYDTRILLKLPPSYGIVTSNLRGQMRLIVLALKGLAEEISNVYVNAESTGIGNVLANKVGLCLSSLSRRCIGAFRSDALLSHFSTTVQYK